MENISKFLFEALEDSEVYDRENIFNDVKARIVEETEDLTKDSGIVKFETLAQATVAKEILEDNYSNVVIKPLQEDSEYDLRYHVVYSNSMEESFNPRATLTCPKCGSDALHFIEYQGNFSLHNCDDCGAWAFGDEAGHLYPEDEIEYSEEDGLVIKESKKKKKLNAGLGGMNWYEDKGKGMQNLNHSLTNATPDGTVGMVGGGGMGESLVTEGIYDDGSQAQIDMSMNRERKRTQAQRDEIENLENSFVEYMGAPNNYQTHIDLLLPTETSKYNVSFNYSKNFNQEMSQEEIEQLENELRDKLDSFFSKVTDDYKISQIYIKNPETDPYRPWKEPTKGVISAYGSLYLPSQNIQEAIENHDELNDKIWDGEELRPEVKDCLGKIVDNFIKSLADNDITIDVKDVQIVGSNAGYNYTNDSDIDLHIIADLSQYQDHKDLAQKLYDAYRGLWNSKYEPMINGHEVEIYVEPYGGESDGSI